MTRIGAPQRIIEVIPEPLECPGPLVVPEPNEQPSPVPDAPEDDPNRIHDPAIPTETKQKRG